MSEVSLEYGFFNSENGDRVYNADDFGRAMEPYSTDGVWKNYGDGFKVTALGMTASVNGGRAMIRNKWVRNYGVISLDISDADTSLDRYDAVVLRLDEDAREITCEIKEGIPSANPAAPEIIDSGAIKELCLATITVAAGATEILDTDITDTRSDESVCGYVKPLVGYMMNKYTNSVVLDADTKSVEIGISEYDSTLDVLLCNVNGVLLNEDVDYTIVGQSIALKHTLAKSNRVTFMVLKYETV